MTEFLYGLAEVTLALSLVVAALLLLVKRLDRRFTPQWRYWAWLAVALRLALPLNVSLPQAPVTVAVPQAAVRVEQPIRPAGPTEFHLNTTPAEQWPKPEDLPRVEDIQQVIGSGSATITRVERIPLSTILFAAWALGACGFLGIQIISYVNFKHRVRRWSRPAGAYQGIPVAECDVVMSPILMGLLRPVIVVPAGGASDYALLHEATHARRRDLWYKLLLVLANAVHWFNPLVWAMRRAAERDLEIACDAAVLAGKDENYRRAYGQALLDTVTAGRKPAAALTSAFSGSKKSLKQRFAALLDMAPRHPGRAALAVLCAVTLLGGSVVACRPAEAEVPTRVPDAPAIPAGDFLDDRSGLYFSAYVGAGVVLTAELRDRVVPQHRELASGEAQVEFLDQEDPKEQLFTLQRGGCAYPTDSPWGEALGESWFQADYVEGLTATKEELVYDDPVSGYRLTLPGRDVGGLMMVSWREEDVFRLLCIHPEMVEQAGMPALLAAGAGVFSLTLTDGEPTWSFGWEEDLPDLSLTPDAEEQCRTVAEARADITAGLERTEDVVLYGRDILYADGRLTFTPLEQREDGAYLARPEGRRTLPLAEGQVWDPAFDTLEGFLQWSMLSSAWIDALKMTVEDGEVQSMEWTNLGTGTHVTATARRQDYALYAAYDGAERVLTYTPIRVDEADMSYAESGLGVQAVQVAETVRFKGGLGSIDGVEDFLRSQVLSSWWPMGLKLTVENDFVVEMEWVRLQPPEDIPAPETRLGVLSGRVDVEAGTVSGLWLDEAGQIDHDAPFTLPVEEGANIQVLDSRGFYTGPITLEDLEQRLLPLSSFGPTFELSILDGAVVGIVTHQGIITNQALREGKPGTEGWTFHQLRSQNPGDGTYTARWEALEGVYNRMKLEAGAETQATVTYTVTDPGEGFVVALVFEDGAVQRLGEGENTVTLPAGRTTLAWGGVDGTAGGFTLEVSPADRVSING